MSGLGLRALITAGLVAMLPPALLDAQQVRFGVGRGYFQVGYQVLDLDALNGTLRADGIPEFEEGFYTLGGGGHVERGRFLFGGEGHGLLVQSETSGGFKRGLAGGYGFFDMGFLVLRSDRFRVFALGGIGAGGIGLTAEERSVTSFEDVLEEPRRGSTLSTGGFLFQLAAGADHIIRFRDNANNGLAVGLRGGYVFTPGDSDWRVNGSDAPGGPEAGPGGAYVRFSVGGVRGR
jgi:hypothetical protein